MIDANELKRLHEAATPGPCEAKGLHPDWPMPADACQYGVVSLSAGHETIRCWTAEDAQLHAYLRNHVTEILAALEDRKRLEWLADAGHAVSRYMNTWTLYDVYGWDVSKGATFRAAIDAARAEADTVGLAKSASEANKGDLPPAA